MKSSRLVECINNYQTDKNDFLTELETLIDQNNPLEKLILKLIKIEYPTLISTEIIEEIDQTFLLGHTDAQFYNRFLMVAMSRLTYVRRTFSIDQKIYSIFSIIESNFDLSKDPDFFCDYKKMESVVQYRQGKFTKSFDILKKLITETNQKYPYYKSIFNMYCNFLAVQGRLEELSPEHKNQLYNLMKTDFTLFNGYIRNSIQTLQVVEGLKEIDKTELKLLGEEGLASKNLLIYLYNNLYQKSLTFQLNERNTLLSELMLKGEFSQAELVYEQLKDSDEFYYIRLCLNKYFLFHLAFAKKEKGKIKLLLKEQVSNPHYLDDLFYGRYYLLDNQALKADFHFRRLMKSVKKYKAMNRVLYELQFAKELSPAIMLRLANGWPIADYRQSEIVDFEEDELNSKEEQNDQSLLIGSSTSIQKIRKQIKQFSQIDSIVLVLGETGTGKELVAKSIHQHIPHSNEPFLSINCAALTDNLLQSELFGYVAGAFTGAQRERKGIFEAAGKGTVFLDEFGDISPKLQATLLRVLESNEIRKLGATASQQIQCKIVVATNVNLEQAVAEKKFREDLYFRLKRFEIHLPALRERKEDIPLLIQYFLDRNAKNEGEYKQISADLLQALITYDWPGNIRELKNEVDRLYILNPDISLIPLECFDFSRLKTYKAKTINEARTVEDTSTRIPANLTEKSQSEDLDEKEIIANVGFTSQRRLKQVKELFEKYSQLSRNQIIEITKASPTTITRDLARLSAEGFIRKITPTKSPRTHYFEIIVK